MGFILGLAGVLLIALALLDALWRRRAYRS